MLRRFRWLVGVLVALTALQCALPVAAESPSDYNKNVPQILTEAHLYAESAILVDADNGDVLFAKDPTRRMYPASTTKIMTLLLALESGVAMDTTIVIPKQALDIPPDSSLIPVYPGDMLTFRDLLYGFMLTSGNDGANAIAVMVNGSVESFVDRMNRRAKELGCEDTHFANPHGYHEDSHYSTALDLARIASEAVKLDSFRKIVSTASYTMSIQRGRSTLEHRVTSSDQLLKRESSYYFPDAIGIKTGYHSMAGQCFVGAAERDGVRLVSVDLKTVGAAEKWIDTIRLFNYGFTRYTGYSMEEMYTFAGSRIATLKVSNAISSDSLGGMIYPRIAQISDPDYVRMVENDNTAAMEQAVDDFISRCELTITSDMVAPISEGEIIGRLRYVDQSNKVITAMLVADRDIREEPPKLELVDFFPFLRHFENPLVLLLAAVLVLLVIMLIVAGRVRNARKERRRKRIYEARRLEYMRRMSAQKRRDERRKRRRDDEDYDEYDDY